MLFRSALIVDIWSCRIARAVLNLLADDVADDLYFEGGQVRRTFLQLLASNHVSVALVEAMVLVTPPSKAALWEELLDTAFGTFKSFQFTDSHEVRRSE